MRFDVHLIHWWTQCTMKPVLTLVAIITLTFCIKKYQITIRYWLLFRALMMVLNKKRERKKKSCNAQFLVQVFAQEFISSCGSHLTLFYWMHNEELRSTVKLQGESPRRRRSRLRLEIKFPHCARSRSIREIPLCLSGILQTGLFLLRSLSGLAVTLGGYLNTSCFKSSQWQLKNACETLLRIWEMDLL